MSFDSVMTIFASVQLPVPDLALLLVALSAIVAVFVRTTRDHRRQLRALSDAYRGELSRANRQLHELQSRLDRTRGELDRERRRNRSRAPARRAA